MKMVNGKWRSQRSLRRTIEALGPETTKPVPIRNEVQNVAAERPSWLIIPGVAWGYGNPLCVVGNGAAPNRSVEQTRVTIAEDYKGHPAAVRRHSCVDDIIVVIAHQQSLV